MDGENWSACSGTGRVDRTGDRRWVTDSTHGDFCGRSGANGVGRGAGAGVGVRTEAGEARTQMGWRESAIEREEEEGRVPVENVRTRRPSKRSTYLADPTSSSPS